VRQVIPDSSREAVLRLARRAARPLGREGASLSDVDLRHIASSFREASVVGFSEALHGAAEPLALRNQLFEYLVASEGFTAIALESGIVESRIVYDYVRGAKGELATVVGQGVSWTFDCLRANWDLIRWIRDYNTRTDRRPINLYGFDVPGSPGEPAAARGVDTAIRAVLEFLERFDGDAARDFQGRAGPLMSNLHFDLHRTPGVPGYDLLGASERAALSNILNDLKTLLEDNRQKYTNAAGGQTYAWALRAAVAALQVDAWLRTIPTTWRPSAGPLTFPDEHTAFLAAARDIRDRAQADNLQWILEQEGPDARVLVFAHRYHLSKVPVSIHWNGTRIQETLGTHLARRLGSRFYSMCNALGRGEYDCDGSVTQIEPPTADSLEQFASDVGYPSFYLNLADAPEPLRRVLHGRHTLGSAAAAFQVPLATAFDAILYLGNVSPALRAHTSC